jgi:hypothetical protein
MSKAQLSGLQLLFLLLCDFEANGVKVTPPKRRPPAPSAALLDPSLIGNVEGKKMLTCWGIGLFLLPPLPNRSMTRGTSSSIDISDIDIGSKKWGFQRHIISNPLNPRYYYDPAAALLRGIGESMLFCEA